MMIFVVVFLVLVSEVATQVYVPAMSLVISLIMRSLLYLIITPSGESQCTSGRGAELDESQSRMRVSPSFTVVSPLITGGLKTVCNSHCSTISTVSIASGSLCPTYSHKVPILGLYCCIVHL